MNHWTFVLLLLSIVLLFNPGRVLGEIQYSRHELPTLYTFDEYQQCFQRNTTSELATTYCMVYAEVKPDKTSEMWQKIRTHFEVNPFNYRHDRLYFGLCLNRCIGNEQSSDIDAESSFTADDIVNNEISQHYANVHKRPLDLIMRQNYSGLIHQCLNAEFERKYNLKLRTFVKYCETRDNEELQEELAKTDPIENVFGKVKQIILWLVILSTLYDYSLKRQQIEENQTNDFYKISQKEAVPRLLTSFSLCRNYYRLLQPYPSSLGTDLAFFDGYRTFCTIAVICFHIVYSNAQHIQNPGYMEFFGNNIKGSMFLNMPIGLEMFMVMSGFFMYHKFTQTRFVTPQSDIRECIGTAFRFITHRFLRFLPSMALMLLFNSTTLIRLGNGPYWRHCFDQYRVFSRENWWKTIFMINNYSHNDTMGPHTWYNGADFQIYIFYTIVLIIMAKYPQYKNRILTCLAVSSVAIPTLISYFLRTGHSYIAKSESLRIGYNYESPEFTHLYTPFYTNLGGYLFGILGCEFYLNHSLREEVGKKLQNLGSIFFFIILSISMTILWLGTIMMFKEPSVWVAIYCGLHRNVWIVCVCGLSSLVMMCKTKGTIIRLCHEFCNLPICRVLSRLSFQMYLWHFLIIKANLIQGHHTYHMNGIYFFSLALSACTASAIVAFFVNLFVELPFAQVLESLKLTSKRKPVNENPKHTKCQ